MKWSSHDQVSAEIAAFCAAWLPDNVFASCIAHGGRNFVMATKLRQLGVQPGIADWIVLYGVTRFVEIKTGKGSMSTDQRRTRERITCAGGETVVVHNLEGFKIALKLWRVPLLHHPRGDAGLPSDEVGL